MNFYPKLHVLKKGQNVYHLDLAHVEGKKQLPVIAFSYLDDSGENLVKDIDHLDISGSELVRNAFSNLRETELTWQKSEEGYLFALDDLVAAEKILDKSFLSKAGQELDTNRLHIAIPSRDKIFACRADDIVGTNAMEQKVASIYNDFSSPQVSNMVFVIEDTAITDAYEVSIDSRINRLEVASTDTFQYQVIKMTLYQELFQVKIMVEDQSMSSLIPNLHKIIHNTLLDYGKSKGFNGKINIQSVEHLPVKSKEGIKELCAFFDRLRINPQILSLCNQVSEKVEISFLFGEDFNLGKSNEKLTLTI